MTIQIQRNLVLAVSLIKILALLLDDVLNILVLLRPARVAVLLSLALTEAALRPGESRDALGCKVLAYVNVSGVVLGEAVNGDEDCGGRGVGGGRRGEALGWESRGIGSSVGKVSD